MSQSTQYVVGIDEVGRGPLAGPVSVGAFAVLKRDYLKFVPSDLKNSKALRPEVRDEWFTRFDNLAQEGKVLYSVNSVSHSIVDTMGIMFAIRLALRRALADIGLDPADAHIYLDGGLRAPKKFIYQETIIKGDEKIPVIAAASIMAKVTRDKKLIDFARRYPNYGFERHKGYATRFHYDRLIEHGPSPIHRRSYLRNMEHVLSSSHQSAED